MEKLSDVKVRRGDIFLSRNPMWLGRLINWVQALDAIDKKSTYSHAGVIVNDMGDTIEAVWTIKEGNIWDDYKGDMVLIARPVKVSKSSINEGINIIRKNLGRWYPFHRFFMMIIPPIARRVGGTVGVCSEETIRYANGAGMNIDWRGKTPDNIHDMVKDSRSWDIIYEGKL